LPYFGGTSRHGAPQRSRQSMPLMIDRFCSGRRPRPRFAASIGSKPFKTCHSASLRSPLLKPASKKAALNQPSRLASISSAPRQRRPSDKCSDLPLKSRSRPIEHSTMLATRAAVRRGAPWSTPDHPSAPCRWQPEVKRMKRIEQRSSPASACFRRQT
jgi:hypothetical protein